MSVSLVAGASKVRGTGPALKAEKKLFDLTSIEEHQRSLREAQFDPDKKPKDSKHRDVPDWLG